MDSAVWAVWVSENNVKVNRTEIEITWDVDPVEILVLLGSFGATVSHRQGGFGYYVVTKRLKLIIQACTRDGCFQWVLFE